MNIGRALGLTAWAAIAAAWALPTPGMVQKSSGFTSVPNNGHSLDAERVQEHAAAHPIGAWPHDAGLVDHLGEPLAPEDYSALANPNLRGLLPPVEFAHPYQGRVLLLRPEPSGVAPDLRQATRGRALGLRTEARRERGAVRGAR
jgi:hypothetical protein